MSDGIDKTIKDKNKCRECMENPFYQCKDNPCNYRFQKPSTVRSKDLVQYRYDRSENTNTNDLFNLDESTKNSLVGDTMVSTLDSLLLNTNINRLAIDNIILLIWACRKGYRDLVEILLSNGADPKIHDKKYGSVIENAVQGGCTHIIDMLIEFDFNLNELVDAKQKYLESAVWLRNSKMVKYLLHWGSDPNSVIRPNRDRYLNIFDTLNSDNLDLLFSHGANMEIATEGTRTLANQIIQSMPPFDYFKIHGGYFNRLQILFKYVDVKQCENYEYFIAGRSLLQEAAGLVNIFCLEYLLKLGLDPNSREFRTGRIPLHRAALNDGGPRTKLLLTYGAQVGAIDRFGNTALHLAVMKCSLLKNKHDDVRDLLLFGARFDVANFKGEITMNLAITYDDDKSIEWMILFGAKLHEIKKLTEAEMRCQKVKKMLERYMIIKRVAGVIEDVDIVMNEELQKLEDKCKNEVDKMKKSKVSGSEIYYIDLLFGCRRKFAKMASKWSANEIMSSYILQNFPIYANWLLKNVNLGIIYGPVYKKSTASLNDIFDSKLPLLVIEKVMNYLNFADMKNLIEIFDQLNK